MQRGNNAYDMYVGTLIITSTNPGNVLEALPEMWLDGSRVLRL